MGILLMNLGKAVLLPGDGLLNAQVLYEIRRTPYDGNELLWYVMQQRFGYVFTLALLATTNLGLAAVSGTVIWYGVSAGSFLAAAMLRYGIKGFLLSMICVFPQCLVYVPVIAFFWAWCQQVCKEINKQQSGQRKMSIPGGLLQFGGILAVLEVGCLLESYVNPLLVQKFLQVF